MSMSDELAGATLNVGEKAVSATIDLSVKTVDLIAKLLHSIFKEMEERNRLKSEKQIADMKMKAEYGVSSSDMTNIKSGEVSTNKLIKNAKETFNSVVYLNDGVNEADKKFITQKAKEYGIPVAFREMNNTNYAMIRECDKNTYQQICTEMIEHKISQPDKAYHNFLCQKWEMPYLSNELNRFNLGAQFGTTKDGKTFCIYRKEDEQAVRIAHGEYLRKHNEIVHDIKFDDNIIRDNNGHECVYEKGMSHSELAERVREKFNFDNTKTEMLCARFGMEKLTGEERKEFFDDNVQRQFSKIQNNINVKEESPYCTPYTCLRVKPKTDEVNKIIYMDKNGNFAILHPEKQSNKSMKKILNEELHITDKKTLDALIDKCRSVSNYYNAEEKIANKSHSKEFSTADFNMSDPEQMKNMRRVDDNGSILTKKLPVISIDTDITRNDKNNFKVLSEAFYNEYDESGNEISHSEKKELVLSFDNKLTAMEQLRDLYVKQGASQETASEMAKTVYEKAEAQNAEQIVNIEEVKAEKFFDSDIPRTSTAEMALNYGDKSATVKLSDTEKAKKEIMDSLGLNEEMAEAAIDSGTTAMSFKQESKLQEFGFDTENLTRKDADYLLDKISKNHWEVPSDIKPSDYVPFTDRADNKVDTSINFDIPTNNDSNIGIRR